MTNDNHIRVLLIEGKRGNHPLFAQELEKKGYVIIQAENGSAGLTIIKKVKTNIVVINAASLRTSGIRICRAFRNQLKHIPIILIVAEGTKLPDNVDVSVILTLPFTIQKLINRIRIYHPAEDKHILQVGPVKLNKKTHFVCCNSHETQLTPRLSSLLKLLMAKPGKIIERETLFKKVWETEYVGDTRTLDVHISWLRRAIEVDPRKPKLIRTERGVGYKLDI